MARYQFDIETDGLLDKLTLVHSLVLRDMDTGDYISCADQPGYTPIEDGVFRLQEADLIVGHNIIRFDIPALAKVYPWFNPKGTVRDTLVMARLMSPKDRLREKDAILSKKRRLPGNLVGSHGLEAFGHRLGLHKGDYSKIMKERGLDPWAAWSEEMQEYCENDVAVTAALWDHQMSRGFSEESIELEHQTRIIVDRQEARGFKFDERAAGLLHAKLVQRKVELEEELQAAFPPQWHGVLTVPSASRNVKRPEWGEVRMKRFSPKTGKRIKDYVGPPLESFTAGVGYSKIEFVPFNPGSRLQIVKRLEQKYGWVPVEKTDKGSPKVDEAVLGKLPYPEAKLLTEYLTIEKRLGQVAEGKEAWLKKVSSKTGRIHGRVDTNGAQTGRMTHSGPNMAQVPSIRAIYGKECRALFIADDGHLLVGCDADALELCCLAGYMARYDDGAYIKTVLSGDKTQGTDIHSVNCRALGMEPKTKYLIEGQNQSGRDIAKTWFYAFIYGAGDEKLGFILGKKATADQLKTNPRNGKLLDPVAQAAGKKSRARFLKNLPALGKLTDAVKAKCEAQGFVKGLDGRLIFTRSAHSALNTLLQGAGAIIMKKALVICDRDLQAHGLVPGRDYEFVANVHDEFQIEALEEHTDVVGRIAKHSITAAGEELNFACPLAGSYDTGRSWADTH